MRLLQDIARRLMLIIVAVPFLLVGCKQSHEILLSGDSIIHSYGVADVGTCQTINIAKGGAGVHDALLSMRTLTNKHVDVSLIAIGVNDAKRRTIPNNFFDNWRRDYIDLIRSAKQVSNHVYLSTILPTEEKRQPYGNYADPDLIKKLNSIIKEVAVDQKVNLIDLNKIFLENITNFTIDGVHLNPNGYSELGAAWRKEIVECK